MPAGACSTPPPHSAPCTPRCGGSPSPLPWPPAPPAARACPPWPSPRRLPIPRDVAARAAGGRRVLAMALTALIAPVVLLVEDLRGQATDAPMISTASAVIFMLVMGRVAGLIRAQRENAARERTLRLTGADLVAASSERDAAAALRKAIAELMPDGEPYYFHLGGMEAAADEDTGKAGVRRVAVADLPSDIATVLTGFDRALCVDVVTAGLIDGGPTRRKIAFLGAGPDLLT